MGSTRQSLLRLSPPFRAEEGGEWLGFLESCGRHSLPCRLASKTLRVPTRKCGVGAPAGDLLHLKQLHAEFYILLTPKFCLR